MIRLCLATDNLDKVAMMIGFLMQTRLVKTRFKGCARTLFVLLKLTVLVGLKNKIVENIILKMKLLDIWTPKIQIDLNTGLLLGFGMKPKN